MFPEYRSRSARVETLGDRINDCFERSMNGTAIRFDSQEMRDMVAYMAFLSRGVAVGIDVISAILRVVFEDEEGGVVPVGTVRDGVYDTANGEVVVGDGG